MEKENSTEEQSIEPLSLELEDELLIWIRKPEEGNEESNGLMAFSCDTDYLSLRRVSPIIIHNTNC